MSRQRRPRSFRKALWYRELVARLVVTGGYCRMCCDWYRHGSLDDAGLRLAHLEPFAEARCTTPANCTLACRRCDNAMAAEDWTGTAPSLEEQPDLMWQPPEPVFVWEHAVTTVTRWTSDDGARTTLASGWTLTDDGWQRRTEDYREAAS